MKNQFSGWNHRQTLSFKGKPVYCEWLWKGVKNVAERSSHFRTIKYIWSFHIVFKGHWCGRSCNETPTFFISTWWNVGCLLIESSLMYNIHIKEYIIFSFKNEICPSDIPCFWNEFHKWPFRMHPQYSFSRIALFFVHSKMGSVLKRNLRFSGHIKVLNIYSTTSQEQDGLCCRPYSGLCR